jgi:hypothetical protein
MESFILKKANDVHVTKHLRSKSLHKFPTLEDLNDNADINMAWKSIRGISKRQPKRFYAIAS